MLIGKCSSCQITESMSEVFNSSTRVRMKDISFLVFSKIIRGSLDSQRRQFGAITMAKLFASIFVMLAFSGLEKTF